MASVPDYTAMSDSGEFESTSASETIAPATVASINTARPSRRNNNAGLNWIYLLVPALAGTFLLAVGILQMRKSKADANEAEDEAAITPSADEQDDIVLQPEGTIKDTGSAEIPELDPEQVKSETAALLESSSIDLLNNGENDGQFLTDEADSFILDQAEHDSRNTAYASSLSSANIDNQELQRTLEKYQFAKERNGQLTTKLREKLAAIEALEKEVNKLRKKVAAKQKKNQKLKNKLREKICVIESLTGDENSEFKQTTMIHDSESGIPPVNLSSDELRQREDIA